MKKQPLEILLIEDQPEIYRWIEASLHACGIRTNISPGEKTFNHNPNDYDLLLISEALFSKALTKTKKTLSLNHIPVPILVLTEGFGTLNTSKYKNSPVDHLPKPALTLPLLKYSIESLLSDFNKTQKLVKLAHFDSLTGAANRHLFNDRLKQALIHSKRYKEPMALLYFDLDKFKQVNDTFGHDVGDKLLVRFVKSLRSCIRETDTICRQGGDEFSVLLLHITQHAATEIAQNILNKLKDEEDIMGHPITIQTSIGIACIKGDESRDCFSMVSITQRADKAVYQAKAEGRNQFCIV